MESDPQPEISITLYIKRKDPAFAASLLRFRYCDHINITVPRTKLFFSMNLSQKNKSQHPLRSSAKLPLFFALEKQEDMLETTDEAGLADLSEEAKRAVVVLRGPINSACYIYDSDFHDLAELHEASSKKHWQSRLFSYCATRIIKCGGRENRKMKSKTCSGRMVWMTSATWIKI